MDYYCRCFHPNVFDPSRCGTCLRPDHMHLTVGPIGESVQEDASPQDILEYADDECDLSEVTTSTNSDDVSGAWTYEWSLGHSLSPEKEFSICDTDIDYRLICSSPTWDCQFRSRSLSSERSHDDVTRFNPSPHCGTDGSLMDERRSRDRSRRPSGNYEQESRYFSPNRRGNSEQQTEDSNKRPYRYYERGHPLPGNYVLEPKACVPFRTVNLGLPSQRRNSETFMQDSWRSESPQRYTYHSNFRRGAESQQSSPSRHNSVSPDRHKISESSLEHQRGSSLSRGQSRSRVQSQFSSHAPSLHSSRCSSTSRRRPSISQSATPSHKKPNSYHSPNGDFNAQNRSSHGSRTPSQFSHKHSLDSEKLYKNLESISHRSSPTIQQKSYEGSQSSPRTAVNSAGHTRTRNSREVSPGRNGYGTHSNTPQKESGSRDSRLSPSQGSWQGSAHSLLSNPLSRGSSTSVRNADAHTLKPGPVSQVTDALEVNKTHSDRSGSSGRRGMDALLISEPKKMSEVVEEVGMTMDDYIELADIPKIYLESEEEYVGLRKRNQSPSPCRNQRTRSERYTEEPDLYNSRLESDDRGRIRERGRDRREKSRDYENGKASRRQSMASVHSQSSENLKGDYKKARECAAPEQSQTQWRKHWFVLGKSSVRFYRDPEESDDPEGEIDLRSCLDVSDCNVEKNYGFQLQTKKAVFTLSAMTSRIRQNWVKLLKQAIQNNTHQSESSSKKDNTLSQRRSPCQPSAQLSKKESRREAAAANSHQDLNQHLDLSQREEGEGWDREQAKRLEERNKWFEEGLSFNEMCSRWDSMELKKGSVPIPVIDTMDLEVNRKWSEFERLSFREMTAQSLIGNEILHSNSQQSPASPCGSQTFQFSHEEHKESFAASETINGHVSNKSSSLSNGSQNSQSKTAEALQTEAFSHRKQVESNKKERDTLGIEVDSPCGPEAPCRAKLKAMVVAHQKELQELQEKHDQEIRELEKQRDKMLKEEHQAAAKAMEKLKAAHLEEITTVKGPYVSNGGAAVSMQKVSQAFALHSELDVLSDGYSQKCLQLNQIQNSSKCKVTDLGRFEKELMELRRENQELKSRLAEEISRMRCFITGQKSDVASASTGSEKNASQIEILLKAKENEVFLLRKEISSLENEVQSLTKEKEAAYEKYKEVSLKLADT